MLITGSSASLIELVQLELCAQYKMKNLGPIQRYLGIEFYSFSGGIFMHQKEYASKILEDAQMTDCKPASVPLPAGTSLSDKTGTAEFDQATYCHTVGQLLYLVNSRPDLS
jgi:hypothetical protein